MAAGQGRRLTRRELLAGGAAATVVVASGTVWLADPRSLVGELVKNSLPGVTFDSGSLHEFAGDFLATWNGPQPGVAVTTRLKLAAAADRIVGTDALTSLGPFDPSDNFTRGAVTYLLLNSNFFDVRHPRAVTIVYTRRPPGSPCRSTPFGDVSPPARS